MSSNVHKSRHQGTPLRLHLQKAAGAMVAQVSLMQLHHAYRKPGNCPMWGFVIVTASIRVMSAWRLLSSHALVQGTEIKKRACVVGQHDVAAGGAAERAVRSRLDVGGARDAQVGQRADDLLARTHVCEAVLQQKQAAWQIKDCQS